MPRQSLPQGSRQISDLQSFLCLVSANPVEFTLLSISMLHPEPWSPFPPCSKLLPRKLCHEPNCLCWGHAAGKLWVTMFRQFSPMDGQVKITALCTSKVSRFSHPSLVSTTVSLPPNHSQDRQTTPLSSCQGLNSTCPHLGAEQERVVLGRSWSIGHFCLCSDFYYSIARAQLGAQGFHGGGINPGRGRMGRKGAFKLLQLLCICHTPFQSRLGIYTCCSGFQW